MQGRTTGKNTFNVVDAFFAEKSLNWTRCSSICTDAATSITGTIKGFVTLAKEKNPNVKWTHCIIHREALASKRMSPQLHDVLNCSIKVINFIKSRPRNSRLFRLLCKNSPYSELFENVGWLAKLCYLAEIFNKLDELNIGLQGKKANILTLHDKISGFLKKLISGRKLAKKQTLHTFPNSRSSFSRKK